MTYNEWKASLWGASAFWQIIDHNWKPEEQNELARLFKAWCAE